MHITVKCNLCGIRFKVAARFADRVCACPVANCDAKIKIPPVAASPTKPIRQPDRVANNHEPAETSAHAPETRQRRRVPAASGSDPTNSRRASRPAPRPIRKKKTTKEPALPTPRTRRQSEPRKARSVIDNADRKRPPRRSTKLGRKKNGSAKKSVRARKQFTPLAAVLVLAIGCGAAFGLWSLFAPATQTAMASHLVMNADETEPLDEPPAIPDTYTAEFKPFVDQYCLDCHGPDDQMAGIGFHKYNSTLQLLEDRKTWERVFRMMNAGAMPPPDHDPLPSKEEQQTAVAWLDDTLNNFDCELIDDPGRPTIRRLNIAEYNNTIRDLVGVDFEPGKNFPSDDVGEGFDNIGDVLSLSPLQLEKYLDAAEDISLAAIVDVIPAPVPQQVESARLKTAGSASSSNDVVHINSSGQAFHEFDFPARGDYILRIEAEADQAGEEPAKVEFLVDNKPVHVADINGEDVWADYEFKLPMTAGRHKFTGSFINDYYNPKAKRGGKDRNIRIRMMEVVGPFNAEPIEPSDTHRRIVISRPGVNGKSFDQAAKEVLERFAGRAFRRPVRPAELARLVFLAGTAANDQPKRFDEGIRVAMQAILVSPHFLFRMESDDDPNRPDTPHDVNDYELASRLSYFLWSSMPDEKLFELAAEKTLNNPTVLEQQVRRMLRDKKAEALVANFAQQWLNLRNLSEVSPDPSKFSTWSNRLRDDMITETEMLFQTVVKEDRSLVDFLDADFTFVNERLAKHYGIKQKVKGEKFQRVSLKGTHRAGILTHASILTLTSNPNRTSPVKRGKWIMENILGSAPPPPPPDVPDLDETVKIDPKLSLREQLAKHREDPGCAACHTTMDALGFGFENFDPIGKYRTKDNKNPIDSSAKLPDGGSFNGAIELIRILKEKDQDFARAMTEKTLVYALGRGLQYYDKCAVDDIVGRLKQNNYRFSSLIAGVVTSKPFRQRRGESPKDRE